jgi:hypothetical protein
MRVSWKQVRNSNPDRAGGDLPPVIEGQPLNRRSADSCEANHARPFLRPGKVLRPLLSPRVEQWLDSSFLRIPTCFKSQFLLLTRRTTKGQVVQRGRSAAALRDDVVDRQPKRKDEFWRPTKFATMSRAFGNDGIKASQVDRAAEDHRGSPADGLAGTGVLTASRTVSPFQSGSLLRDQSFGSLNRDLVGSIDEAVQFGQLGGREWTGSVFCEQMFDSLATPPVRCSTRNFRPDRFRNHFQQRLDGQSAPRRAAGESLIDSIGKDKRFAHAPHSTLGTRQPEAETSM